MATPKTQKMAVFCGFANDYQDRGRSGDEAQAAGSVALFGDQFVGFLEALAALRRLAELGVKRLGIAVQRAGRLAQFGFTNGIADADVHGFAESPLGRFLMRMDCNIKWWNA